MKGSLGAGWAAAWAEFRLLPPGRHVAGLLLVALLIGLRFAGPLFAGQPIEDEEIYAAAFERVASGASPYANLEFYYLPPFAAAGAFLFETIGLVPALYLLRFLNLVATAGIAWLATGCWRLSFVRRILVAAIYGALAPAVHLALAWGNLSPLAIACWLLAFLLWRRRPLVAGALYALAMLVKPIAALGVVLLALHRPAGLAGKKAWRPQLLCTGMAAVLILAALAASPHLPAFFGLAQGIPEAARSASLHRLLHCFAIDFPAVFLLPAVALPAILLLRRRPRGEGELYLFAAIAGLFATPLVWSHTLLLTLPLQSVALAQARERYLRHRRSVEPLLVLTAVLAIQLSNGLGGVETWPLPVQGLFVLLPCFAPLGLALYLATTLREGPAPKA